MQHSFGQSTAEDELYCTVAAFCRKLVPDVCHVSLALVDGEGQLHFYSLSEHASVGHIHTMTLPLENTSAGLAMKFRWTVCTSKLGKRGLRRLDWLMLQRATAPGSMICLPILASQRVLGVLNIAAQSPSGVCSVYKELQKFADILAPALAMRRQRNKHKVVNGLLDRLYPEHIRERLHEMQQPMRPPIPEQVISALQEAAGLPGAPLDGHRLPSADVQRVSPSSTDPQPSFDNPLHSVCHQGTSKGSSAPATMRKHFSASQSPDGPTAGGQHAGVQQAEHMHAAHIAGPATAGAQPGALRLAGHMRAAQAAKSRADDHHHAARAAERILPVSCGRAAVSAEAEELPGTSSGEEADAWKPGEASSGVYAPSLVLEGAAVLLTALSLLSALCRCLPLLVRRQQLLAIMAAGLCCLVAILLVACPALQPNRNAILTGTRIVRTAVFAGHLVLAPMPALPQAGLQLAVDSGAFLIAVLALACQVPYRQHVLTQLASFQLLFLAEVARAFFQKVALGITVGNIAAQLLMGVLAPSLALRWLELDRPMTQHGVHAKFC